MSERFAVVIPAYKPSKKLDRYIERLTEKGAERILVVNDGNTSDYDSLFQKIAAYPSCIVLTHTENKGKGAAMKTAFSYFLQHEPGMDGVVTADADDQHAVEDVIRIGHMLSSSHSDLILGVRTFEYGKVPTRSFIGNTITSFAFKLFFKYDIQDTQTGLRAIDRHTLEWMTQLRGEKFEYEMNMLINAAKRGIRLEETEIETIYHENHQSNYQSYHDSVRIIHHIIKGFFIKKSRTEPKAEKETL